MSELSEQSDAGTEAARAAHAAFTANGAEPLVQIRGLTAGYVSGIDIIHDVDLEMNADEIVTIIGPNGAGKSTLIKGLMGALPYVTGERRLAGRDVSDLDAPRMVAAGVGYVPQRENVFASLSIRENLEMGGYRRHGDLEQRIDEVLGMFPVLRERPRERASRLSGGQRQMLAIARALMLDPHLLCLDEPTASLSPAARVEIFERVSDIHRNGVGVLLVEQNATEALRWSDRGVVMVNGEKALDAPAEEMLASGDVGRLFLGRGLGDDDDEGNEDNEGGGGDSADDTLAPAGAERD